MSTSKKSSTDQSQHTHLNQSWGGRFNEPVDAFVARFTASVNFDRRLFRHDIQGSIAHASMLLEVGVLTDSEVQAIISGLEAISSEIESGEFTWSTTLEDVHMNIEAALTARIGDVGKKLHTGRSRNDQVATDIRLWLRDEIDAIALLLSTLQTGMIELAATTQRHYHARLYPPANRPTGDLWASLTGLERDARARLQSPHRLP